jgi:hypothetical protein
MQQLVVARRWRAADASMSRVSIGLQRVIAGMRIGSAGKDTPGRLVVKCSQ